MKIHHAPDPGPMRAQAYPPIGDQLDAVMKLAESLAQSGFALPTEVVGWIEKCQEVKAKYPKPK